MTFLTVMVKAKILMQKCCGCCHHLESTPAASFPVRVVFSYMIALDWVCRATGNFAVGNYAVRNFAVRKFCRKEISPLVNFAVRRFRRRKIRRTCIRMMITHYAKPISVIFEAQQSVKTSYEAMSAQTINV